VSSRSDTTTEALVSLRAVGKRFRTGVTALDGIDLAIAPGGFVSLLGPSGCGKSTLLRMIAGLETPSAGRVSWRDDADPRGQGRRGGLGFVFQEPTLMPWASAMDNIFLPLRLAGQSRGEAAGRIAEAVALVGLEGFERAFPRELSGGMRMRVSIARAIVTHPRLLLLDEPFAALDEITRFKLNDDLLRLWRAQNLTVVFVTHSVFESVYLSNRVVVMTPRPGRIAADLAIDLPQPREGSLRTSPAFGEQCRRVSDRLAKAMAT